MDIEGGDTIDEQTRLRTLAAQQRALELMGCGDLDEAELLASAAADDLRRSFGSQHPSYAAAIGVLARVTEARGRLLDAIVLARRALALLEPDHREMAARVGLYLGPWLAHMGEFAEAERLARSALGSCSPDERAQGWLQLGTCLCLAGRYDDAEHAFACAGQLGAGQVPAWTLAQGRARLALGRGQYAEAERLAHAAHDFCTGHDDFACALTLRCRAEAIANQGNHDLAEALYREALARLRSSGRPSHIETIYTLHDLAHTLAALGRHLDAEASYREAIALGERILGDHHQVGVSLARLGALFVVQGYHHEAIRFFERARALVARLPDDHPIRVSVDACSRPR